PWNQEIQSFGRGFWLTATTCLFCAVSRMCLSSKDWDRVLWKIGSLLIFAML
ncbi:hypothetical protein NPIL_463061, partial [Nephila pilipes]